MRLIVAVFGVVVAWCPSAMAANSSASTSMLADLRRVPLNARPLQSADVCFIGRSLKDAHAIDTVCLETDADCVFAFYGCAQRPEPSEEKGSKKWDSEGRQLRGHIAIGQGTFRRA
jgi:hypothetical protein